MNPSLFTEKAPGRLVEILEGVHAFLPAPLPTSLQLPLSTINLLGEAERTLGILKGTTARELNPYLVGSPLLHREAILSSRIEGTVTTPEKLAVLDARLRAGAATARDRDKDTQEVLNYIAAMRHGVDLLRTLPISLRLIREVHKELMRGVRGGRDLPGEFRRGQNYIQDRPGGSIHEARFVPPPKDEMERVLGDLETYLHRERGPDCIPPLVEMALIHYQFEAIHPFRDGNGRIGRLLIPLLLIAQGRIDGPILYLSGYLERNREQYMDYMLRISQTGDWTSWIDFFLSGVAECSIEANQQALALLDLRTRYHRQCQQERSSARLIRLIDYLFQSPSITFKGAIDLLEVSHQTAAYNIHRLEREGILREVTGRSKNQVFAAPEILKVMQEGPSTGELG